MLVYENRISESKIGVSRAKFIEKVKSISKDLGINPDWLMAVMWFESKLSPSIQNSTTNATGFIQFMPTTAAGLGTSVYGLKQMNGVQQLDYVKKYLYPYRTKMKSFVDVYLTVFYPKAVGKPDNYIVGSHNGTWKAVTAANKPFDVDKDGEITIGNIKTKLFEILPEMKDKEQKKGIYIFLAVIVIFVIVIYIYRKPVLKFAQTIISNIKNGT